MIWCYVNNFFAREEIINEERSLAGRTSTTDDLCK
jgi:hypothetical protein